MIASLFFRDIAARMRHDIAARMRCGISWSALAVWLAAPAFWVTVAVALFMCSGCASHPAAAPYPLEQQIEIPVTYRYQGTSQAWCAKLTMIVGRQGWIVIDADPRRVHLVLLEELKPGCNPG